MSDIPVHKLQNQKPVIESLHVLFTLFSEFRSNQHFQQQNNDADVDPNLANFWRKWWWDDDDDVQWQEFADIFCTSHTQIKTAVASLLPALSYCMLQR